MAPLTKQELIELDHRIDSAIPSQGLLTFPRDVAVIHLLRLFEDYARLYVLSSPQSFKSEAYTSMLKKGQDGMHFAVNWLYQYCSPANQKKQLDLQVDAYVQAGHLHEAAMQYSTVWDLMAMLQRGLATGEVERDGTISIKFTDPSAEDVEVASYFVDPPDSPDSRDEVVTLEQGLHPKQFLSDITIRRHSSGSIKYFVPDEVFSEVAEYERRLLSSRWELDGIWDIGGYSISDFREFWVALLTFCWIHHWVCISSGIKGGALKDVVKMRHHNGWGKELARHSGLDAHTVGLIIEDLTYDSDLYMPGRKQPDVTSQPFFPLRPQFLALSNQLVMLSNAERNLWDLISIKRPEIHSVLRNKKEELWLRQLIPKLKEYGLKVFGPIKFVHNERRSDLDLLILDSSSCFGLGCQLKWLTHPDRIRDVKYADEELRRGIAQAQLSLEWLNSRSDKLQEATGLSINELAQWEFRAAVLSKNTLGSARTYEPGAPILNERLINWIIGSPLHRDLRTLWMAGEERRYLPQRGRHFTDEDTVVEFGGVRLLGKRMSMRINGRWNPAEDINLTGL